MPTFLREEKETQAGNLEKLEIIKPLDTQPIDTQGFQYVVNKKPKKITFGKILSLFIFFVGLVLMSSFIFGYSLINKSQGFLGQGSGQDLFSQFANVGSMFNLGNREKLQGENEGRTNFLLIGKDATGAGLTDTMMIVSYYYDEQQFVSVNIPRDLFVQDSFGDYKINSLVSFAEGRGEENGEKYLADFLSEELQIPVHYWASVSFDGVEEVVDTIGGIEIDVPNAFEDQQYPAANYNGFLRPAPSFQQGKTTMNGETALIYARSRYGNNNEGSDFARGKRQSIVIEAILRKLQKQNLLNNATKINSYLEILKNNFSTSMGLSEITSFAKLLQDSKEVSGNFHRAVWETGNGFLCPSSSLDGAYIIGYCDGAFLGDRTLSTGRQRAQKFLNNLLEETVYSSLYDSKVVVIGNQSFDTQKVVDAFAEVGFNNIKLNNIFSKITPATATSIEKTKVYFVNKDTKNIFERTPNKPTISYEIGDSLPYDVTGNYSEIDILVVVESQSSTQTNNQIKSTR